MFYIAVGTLSCLTSLIHAHSVPELGQGFAFYPGNMLQSSSLFYMLTGRCIDSSTWRMWTKILDPGQKRRRKWNIRHFSAFVRRRLLARENKMLERNTGLRGIEM